MIVINKKTNEIYETRVYLTPVSKFDFRNRNFHMDRKIQIMERRRIIRKIISFFHFNKLIGAERVVFPQHEIFYTDSASYLKEAAQLDIDL